MIATGGFSDSLDPSIVFVSYDKTDGGGAASACAGGAHGDESSWPKRGARTERNETSLRSESRKSEQHGCALTTRAAAPVVTTAVGIALRHTLGDTDAIDADAVAIALRHTRSDVDAGAIEANFVIVAGWLAESGLVELRVLRHFFCYRIRVHAAF